MRAAFIESLIESAKTNEKIFLLVGDIGYNLVEPFRDAFPQRFENVGIAEQNMVGIAAGLALSGKTVFVYSIANFPTVRCVEQIRNDVCYHNADVKIVSAGGGLVYGALGMTHHLTDDIAHMRALPNMTGILERLLGKSAHELWIKETIAATDATGNPHCKGKNWRKDRDDFKKHRGYDKAHYIVGTRSLVIPHKRVTRGTWSDLPEFEPLVQNSVPGSNITQIVADSGYVDNSNYELAGEYGATPYIKPKDNAVFRPHPSNAYERMVHYATKFPKRWKDVYRFRVKAECAIHSKKATFGDIIRGKYPPSRRNQELLRDIVHNFRMTLMDRYGG